MNSVFFVANGFFQDKIENVCIAGENNQGNGVTAQIRLLPSGKVFAAEAGESLLEAALRAGVSLSYSCSNGTCGDCKAKLVSGVVQQKNAQDYHFSEAEKRQNFILLCSVAADSDLEIQVQEANRPQDIPVQQIATRVEKLERLGEDVMALHLRPPRSQTLQFLAGQHVSLEIAGIPPRNKSLASCPCNAMQLEFHIRYAPDDPFADYVFNRLKLSDPVKLSGPWGNFILDDDSLRPIIFFAFETGFGPIKSIIQHAIALELAQPMHLYWLANSPDGHYMENHCRSWEDALDNFTYTPLSGAGGADCPLPISAEFAAQQFIQAGQRVGADHPDLSGFDVYLSGPESTMQPLIGQLRSYSLSDDRLKVDFMQRF